MSKTKFAKFSGNGNDFIIMEENPKLTSEAIEKLCHRNFGIGADGVITLGKSQKGDTKMRIFNADGGEAEMCGNGVRCLTTYFDQITSNKKDTYQIETMNAVYPIVRKGDTFALEMKEIKDKNIHDLSGFLDYQKSFFINTGVPHLVFLTNDVKRVEIKLQGAKYRFHPMFPKGTNVNFVQVVDEKTQTAYVRTYERGVEDETFSCGTGLTATALALAEWFSWKGEVNLKTKGGSQVVSLADKVLYSGEVKACFEGEVEL